MDPESTENQVINADGSFISGWVDKMPDDTFALDSETGRPKTGNLKDFKNLSNLAKSYMEQQTKLGSAIHFPADNAEEKEKATALDNIARRLGWPEKAEDYKIEIPEGVKVDEPLLKESLGKMHTERIPQRHAQMFVDEFNSIVTGIMMRHEKELEEKHEQVRQEMIKEAGSEAAYNEGKELAIRLLEQSCGDWAAEYLETSMKGIDSQLIKLLMEVAKTVKAEDRAPKPSSALETKGEPTLRDMYPKSPELGK